MLVAGLAVVAVYLALRALHVLGQPTVIGGGMILLLGYVLAVVGLVWVITALSGHHDLWIVSATRAVGRWTYSRDAH